VFGFHFHLCPSQTENKQELSEKWNFPNALGSSGLRHKGEWHGQTTDINSFCMKSAVFSSFACFYKVCLNVFTGPHWPGPGARNSSSCFGRLWRENAGEPFRPCLVMLEGIRYLGPGEQLGFTPSWRAPKENTGALHLVGSCWEIPLSRDKGQSNVTYHIRLWC